MSNTIIVPQTASSIPVRDDLAGAPARSRDDSKPLLVNPLLAMTSASSSSPVPDCASAPPPVAPVALARVLLRYNVRGAAPALVVVPDLPPFRCAGTV